MPSTSNVNVVKSHDTLYLQNQTMSGDLRFNELFVGSLYRNRIKFYAPFEFRLGEISAGVFGNEDADAGPVKRYSLLMNLVSNMGSMAITTDNNLVLVIDALGRIKDKDGNVLISPSGLGPSMVSNITTLGAHTVTGNLTLVDSSIADMEGNTLINKDGLGSTVVQAITSLPAHDVTGDIRMMDTNIVDIDGSLIISKGSLGENVVSSSLTSVGTLNGLNVDGDTETSGSYKIGGNAVLSGDTLGLGIVNSSLTSVGPLNSLAVNGLAEIKGNGTTRSFFVDSDGSVVVGNGVPEFAGFTIRTTSNFLSTLNVRGNGVSTGLYVNASNNTGFGVGAPQHRVDVSGSVNISIANSYKINGVDILTASTLGSSVTSATGLTSIGTLGSLTVTGDINSTSGSYNIGGVPYMSASTIGVLGTTDLKAKTIQTSANVVINSSSFLKIGTENTLSRTTLGSEVVNSSLTSLGQLGSLIVTGMSTIPKRIATVTSTGGIATGPQAALDGGVLGYGGEAGAYQILAGWDTAGTTHDIVRSSLSFNSSNDNWCGILTVYASNKSSITPKLGILEIDVMKIYGSSTLLVTVKHEQKSPNLSILTAVASGSVLRITTDSDVKISWSFRGSI